MNSSFFKYIYLTKIVRKKKFKVINSILFLKNLMIFIIVYFELTNAQKRVLRYQKRCYEINSDE